MVGINFADTSRLSTSRSIRSGMCRLAVVLATATIVLLFPSSSRSFIGNWKIGGFALPCAVACGGDRGIINPNFAGDAINQIFAAPTIDNFHNALDASIDRGLGKFEDLLNKKQADFFKTMNDSATAQRQALIAEMHSSVTDAMAQLDKILRGAIDEADERIKARLKNGEIVARQASITFNSMLLGTFILIMIIAAIAYMASLWYKTVFVLNRPARGLVGKYVVISLLTLAVSGVAYFVKATRDYWLTTQITADAERDYDLQLKAQNPEDQLQDLDNLIFYARQLEYIAPTDEFTSARLERALILRDVFRRPAVFRTTTGGRDLISRLNSAQTHFIKAGKGPDIDLTMLYGFLLWERGNDRFSEYFAACLMAGQIERLTKESSTNFVPMLPLAYLYLSAYLSYPLSDEIVQRIYDNAAQEQGDGAKSETFVALSGDQRESLLVRRYKLAELQRIRDGVTIDIERLAKTNSLYAFTRINLEAVRVVGEIGSLYSELLRLTAVLKSSPEDKKGPTRTSIRNVGKAMVTRWDQYLKFLTASDYADETARLNNLKNLWPIYLRAMGAMALKDSEDVITAAPEAQGIHQKWLNQVVHPMLNDDAFKLFSITAKVDYELVDSQLNKLEASIPPFLAKIKERQAEVENLQKTCGAHYSDGSLLGGPALSPIAPLCDSMLLIQIDADLVDKAAAMSRLSATLGVIGCRHPAAPNVDCSKDDVVYRPFGTLLYNSFVKDKVDIDEDGKMTGALSDEVGMRVVPAL
jgi:hypothetical protein